MKPAARNLSSTNLSSRSLASIGSSRSLSSRVFPSPRSEPVVGHLGRWGKDPLGLLREGAELGPVFRLRLWRRVVVGYSPDWNRFVLGDLNTFRSKGSMSGLSPYLAGGLVQTDFPEHRQRRTELNPAFHRKAVTHLAQMITELAVRRLPIGEFDAGRWASDLMPTILNEVLFAGALDTEGLADFLRPLDSRLPGPMLRRPVLFRRMNRDLAAAIERVPPDAIGSVFRGLGDGVAEARVVLSAGYDTTAHTLAWALWHGVSGHGGMPGGLQHEGVLDGGSEPDHAAVIEETLRLYPAGWVGSRVASCDTEFDGVAIKAGTMVLYSPYLTHRDPQLWDRPTEFRADRFIEPSLPAWGFVPFAAGERTCLGMHLARLILGSVLAAFDGSTLSQVSGDPNPRAGITLAPATPLILNRI